MDFISVISSDLSQVGYNEGAHELTIIFNSGGVYTYSNVPKSIYDSLLSAESKGKFFHANIKDKFTFRRSY